MTTLQYFKIYRQTLSDSLQKIKKVSFKKMTILKQLIQTIEIFLSKQVYGRIVPGNYLLLFILLLGTKNVKLIEIGIRTIYKLFSSNFIHDNEELSLGLLRQEFKEFLLIDVGLLRSRTFKEIYLETLMGIQEKDEGIIMLISKNISLVVRMFQHSLDTQSILSVQQYLFSELVSITGRNSAIEKPLKSTLVQILRHILENLRELDYNVLFENGGYDLQKVCRNSLTLIVDEIVMKEAVEEKYPGVGEGYKMIPQENFKEFKVYRVSTENENSEINGKFGWCVRCRKPADYYCKQTRVPVCSFECKNRHNLESQQFDKCLADETKAQQIFVIHSKQIVLSLARDLLHQDIKRRVITADVINLIFSQPKRFKNNKNHLKSQLSLLFKNSLLNINAQNEAYSGSLVIIMKKLVHMDCFINQIELLFEIIVRKIENIQMNSDYKYELLKCVKEMIGNGVMEDVFVNLDCELKRKNSLERLVRAMVAVYAGIKVPDVVFEEEGRVKVLIVDVVGELIRYLKEMNKRPEKVSRFHLISLNKEEKGKILEGIELFNTEAKPQKGLKLLWKEKLLAEVPGEVALFLMKNLDILKPTQVGECVGSHDEFLIKCLDSFIELISFQKMDIDEGMRHLLDHFTLPSESQQVSRIIESFGNKFYKDNKSEGIFASSSAVYSFSYLLMMLQSNLHNPQVVDKMKFADYQKLAKGMNEGNDFPLAYLQHLYNSIQKNQLGFHEKQKEKDFAAAYQQGGKKLAEIYQKEIEKLAKRVESQFKTFSKVLDFRPRVNCIREMWTALNTYVIEALIIKFRSTEEKQNQIKILAQFEELIIISIDNELIAPQEKILSALLAEINFDFLNSKQSLIIQNIMEWSVKYTNYIGSGWKMVFTIISSFQKRKCIVKVKEPKSKVLVVLGDRLCLQEGFIENIFTKSPQYSIETIIHMLNGLIYTSSIELKDEQHIFSLQRILDLIECNLATLPEIFKLIWPPLREYFFELGLSANEKIALFGVDFLKQFILKLMKKKETIVFQKDYFVLYETIFTNCQLEGVKEFILGSISSLSSHNASQFKQAWKPILSVYLFSFQNKNSEQIKIKTFQALNKLIESSLMYMEDYLFDLIHILGKLSKQKQQVYLKGCLRMIQEIIQYYNKKQVINPENPSSTDIEFLQKTLLPLLNIVATICGDHRSDLQGESMNVLFNLLMTYGILFNYEFWKMVFQGVIRPTFDEILYTYQTRGNEPKKEVTEWLKASFTKLFNFISELVNKYYSNFRLFLADIFKIYENCIQNSNELLTKLSINAVKALIERVGHIFIEEDWDHFLTFLQTLFKKTTPFELSSIESWRLAKQEHQTSNTETYTTKCLSQLMLLDVADNVLERFSVNFSDDHLQKLKEIVTESYEFTRNFNSQFDLRNSLWQEGFLSDMKQLPGLLKQQRQSLKCLVLLQFYRYQLAEQKHQASEQRFQQYISLILNTLNLYLQKQRLLLVQNSHQISKQETQRVALNMRILVRDTIIPQLEETDIKLIQPYRSEFFKILLEMLRYSTTMKRPCLGCQRCEKCADNFPIEIEFDEAINKLILGLFELEGGKGGERGEGEGLKGGE